MSQVRSLAILDSDLVFLSWRDNSNRGLNVDSLRVISANDTTFKLPNLDSAILTFYADYEQHHTRIGGEEKGFILCFQCESEFWALISLLAYRMSSV